MPRASTIIELAVLVVCLTVWHVPVAVAVLGAVVGLALMLLVTEPLRRRRERRITEDELTRQEVRAEWARRELDQLSRR